MQRKYTDKQRKEAMELAKKIGFSAASKQLGIGHNTIRRWVGIEERRTGKKQEGFKPRPLTPMQKVFIQEYLVDLDAAKSAERAGYKGRSKEMGYQLMLIPAIREAIDQAMAERSKRTMVTADRVLEEYARLGFFDPRKLFRGDGSPKDISELDDDTAAVLAGLEVVEIYEGKGKDKEFVGYLKKYKLADKKGALDSMARHLGMFKDIHEHTGKDGGPIEANVKVSRTAGMTDEEIAVLANELLSIKDDPDDDLGNDVE